MEDADHLVDGGMVDVLFVALVQAVELRRDNPERDRQEEHAELEVRACVSLIVRDQTGDEERADEPGDVGNQQRAPNEPASPPCRDSARWDRRRRGFRAAREARQSARRARTRRAPSRHVESCSRARAFAAPRRAAIRFCTAPHCSGLLLSLFPPRAREKMADEHPPSEARAYERSEVRARPGCKDPTCERELDVRRGRVGRPLQDRRPRRHAGNRLAGPTSRVTTAPRPGLGADAVSDEDLVADLDTVADERTALPANAFERRGRLLPASTRSSRSSSRRLPEVVVTQRADWTVAISIPEGHDVIGRLMRPTYAAVKTTIDARGDPSRAPSPGATARDV